MASEGPDWTPLAYIVGGGVILKMIHWIATRLMMVLPTRAAQKRLEAKQQKFHDDLRADMKIMHDAIAALAGHQEAQDAEIAHLKQFLPRKLNPDGR